MQTHEKKPFLIWCLLIIAAIVVFFSISGNKLSTKEFDEINRIIENKEASDLLNDLYIASNGDVESIARILNVTPSSINRVRNGETTPSFELEDRIREVSRYYYKDNKDFYRLRSDLDPSWNLLHTIGYSRQTSPLLFWSIIIIISIFYLYFNFKNGFQNWKVTSILLVIIIVLYAISAAYANHFPKEMDDDYSTTINPVIESLQ